MALDAASARQPERPGARPRDTIALKPPRRVDDLWPHMLKRVAGAHEPQGTIPESWIAGLGECVRRGYLDRPRSVVPLHDYADLRQVAPTVMATPGIRGFLGFSVFVAWCSDLRQSTMRDFPEVSPCWDNDAEVTMLARCLDIALVEPSWLIGCHPRVQRVLAKEVRNRLVSEVPDLLARVKGLPTWRPEPNELPSWCDAMALAAVRQWQDDVLDETEDMGAKSLLWYRVLKTWGRAWVVTGKPVPGRVERWLETTNAPQGVAGSRAKMALAGWRSVRLIHGLCQTVDGCPLLQENTSEASDHQGAIGVAAVLLGLGRRQVEGYWRRRKERCQGWPLRQPIPWKLLFFANDP